MRGVLVAFILGIKPKSLAGLGSVSGGGLGRALLVEVVLPELILRDSVVLEVKVAFLLEEAVGLLLVTAHLLSVEESHTKARLGASLQECRG